jgi:hypothetical protein
MQYFYFPPSAEFNKATIMLDAMDLAVNAGHRKMPLTGGASSPDHCRRRDFATGGSGFSFAAIGKRLSTPVRWAAACTAALTGIAIAGWIT